MRVRVLPLVLCGLLFVTGATRAAPAPDGDEAKVAEYVKALKSKNAAVRKQVALALGELGEKAKSAVPALREALLDADDAVQAAAAAALEKIGGGPKAPADKDAEVKKLREEVEAARRRADAEAARAKETSGVLKDKMREWLDAMEKVKVELLDRATAAEIKAKALQQRNEQLVEQIEKLTAEKLLKPTDTPPKPAPENVEGLVKAVDEKSGLVTITIGSDAGLQKGHKLDVYRMKPAPKYLGQVEIVDVTATQAVAKPVGKAKDTIEKGDSVSSGVLKK